MERKKIIFFFIIFFLFIIALFFYFNSKKNINLNVENKKNIEENIYSSNLIDDVKYSSTDNKGNEYIINASTGEIDYSNSNVVYLTNVKAIIKLSNSNEIIITSEYGKYNIDDFDTIFSKNVIINYLDNKITGEYLDFSPRRNSMIVSVSIYLIIAYALTSQYGNHGLWFSMLLLMILRTLTLKIFFRNILNKF